MFKIQSRPSKILRAIIREAERELFRREETEVTRQTAFLARKSGLALAEAHRNSGHTGRGGGGLADMETVCSLPTREPEGCPASDHVDLEDDEDEGDVATEAAVKSAGQFFKQLWRSV